MVRRLEAHFTAFWALYWGGWAVIWGCLSVFLLYRGFTNSQIGIISSCALLLPLAVQPPLASLADRSARFTSRALSIILTAIILACAAAVCFSGSSRAVTAALFVVIGVAITCIPSFFNAMSMDYVLRGVPVNFGASRSGGSIAYAAVSLLTGVVLERVSPACLPPVFLVFFTALLLALVFFRYPLPELRISGERPTPQVLSNLALLQRYPAYSLMLLSCCLLLAAHTPVTSYMIHIVAKAGGSESTMGIALFLSGLMELPALLLFSRFRRRLPLPVLLCLCAGGFLLRDVLFLLAQSTLTIYIASAMQFFSFGLYIPASVYYVTESIDTANQVKGQALLQLASSGIGSAIGSLICGRLLDTAGVGGMLAFCCLSAAAGLAVMVLAMYFHRRKGVSPL